ncbi:MAG: molybdate ABC transporter substrate-binding protein [Acidobacteriota bacterium]
MVLDLSLILGMVLAQDACTLYAGRSEASPVLVLAAASVADVLAGIMGMGPETQIASGGSFALERQIEAGAPADLFVSAGRPPVDALLALGLAKREDVRLLAGNVLVLVVPAGGSSAVSRPRDLLSLHRIAMGDPETVPAGFYGRAALRHHHLWSRLQERLIRAVDVRAVLAYVESGAVDAGLVYGTDARLTARVKIAFPFAPGDHPPIQILAVALKRAPHRRQALALLEILTSPKGGEHLRQAGFILPPLPDHGPEEGGV